MIAPLRLKAFALLAITTYQRFVSPFKGYCCASRVHTGRSSCSVLGYRAIRRYGVWSGVAVLRQRFERCAGALRAIRTAPPGLARQRGFCDLSCDGPSCDLPSCDHGMSDLLSPCDCCDVGDCGGSRKNADEPVIVHLPAGRWKSDA